MDLSQNQPSEPVVSEIGLAFAVYVLYCIAYVTGGLSSVIGVIIAHAKVGDAEPMLKTHYQWQIRTFWIGLLYLVAGTILCFIVIGIFVLMWWFVWSLVRIVKGILALNDRKPIGHQTSWMFG